MVAFVSSYLFANKTRLNDIYERKANKTTQSWTSPQVPGNKLATQRVFVLTSHDTFSAAEDFTYGLKNLKRATIVGEKNWCLRRSGADPREPFAADLLSLRRSCTGTR